MFLEIVAAKKYFKVNNTLLKQTKILFYPFLNLFIFSTILNCCHLLEKLIISSDI